MTSINLSDSMRLGWKPLILFCLSVILNSSMGLQEAQELFVSHLATDTFSNPYQSSLVLLSR